MLDRLAAGHDLAPAADIDSILALDMQARAMAHELLNRFALT
ncbi:hypothetical protein V6L77_25350 [Pannonibacter sp. Pt2-lr]